MPRTRAMLLRFPGLISGGFVWNRPSGLIVDENGEIPVAPAAEMTRSIQWTLLGVVVGAAAAVVAIRVRRRRYRGFAASLRRGELGAAARSLPQTLRRLPFRMVD